MKFRLNRKGFTLIELLAVIVILAIILVIAMPMALDAMNSSRISSIHSSAKGVANWYAEAVVADALVEGDLQTIPEDMYVQIVQKGTNTWFCMDEIVIGTGDTRKSLFDVADLNDTDIVRGDSSNRYSGTGTPSATTCASMKINTTGAPTVLLVAEANGKFAISGNVTYGNSSEANGKAEVISGS